MGVSVKDILVAARTLIAGVEVSRKRSVASVIAALQGTTDCSGGGALIGNYHLKFTINATAYDVLFPNGQIFGTAQAFADWINNAVGGTFASIVLSAGFYFLLLTDPANVYVAVDSVANGSTANTALFGYPANGTSINGVTAVVGDKFLKHTTNQPFDKAPVSKRDGFEVVARQIKLTSAFGVTGDKETTFKMVVRVGHAPFATDEERENLRVKDVARLADLLENNAWPAGVEVCLYEEEVVDKTRADWWLTELFFNVFCTGAVELT